MKIKPCQEYYYRVSDKNFNIFEELNTSLENIFRNNSKLEIYEGEWIKVRTNNFVIHHVKPMETIKDIAKNYNINAEKILKDNNLENEKLFIGQKLKVFK